MDSPKLKIIGTLQSEIKRLEDAPNNFSISDYSGTLEIAPQFQEAIEGVQPGQTIIVLFWLHKSNRNVLKVHPRGDTSRPICGVFNTRSPVRPNPIAISELKVTAVNGCNIEVTNLDILDGTPIIDIKKKL